MILTKRALTAINKVSIRIKLADTLKCTEQWIIRLIDANKNNGPLTTYSALQVIKSETNLSDDQILEPAKVKA